MPSGSSPTASRRGTSLIGSDTRTRGRFSTSMGNLYEDADEAAMEGLEMLRGAAQTDTRRTPDGHQVIPLDRSEARNQL
jgi:hypothetical protein